MEFLCLAFIFNNDIWFTFFTGLHFEWPVFHVWLHNRVVEFSTNKSFSIKDCVVRIFCVLIFCWITNQSFCFGKSYIRGSGSIALIISDNLDSVILPDSHTRISCSKINSNCFWCVTHFLFLIDYRITSSIFISMKFF